MKKILTPLIILLIANILAPLHAQEGWHVIKSSDGAIEAMLPGPAKKQLDKRRTLAGTIVTKVMQFHTDDVEFTISSTRLPKLVRRLADDERLYKNARTQILNRFYGQEKSFEEITIDDIPARELHYEVADFHDEAHSGYHGVAVFLVRKEKVYVANAIMEKEDGNTDLKKFRESIKLNNK